MIELLEKTRKTFFSRPIITFAGWVAFSAIIGFSVLLGLMVWALKTTHILTGGWMEETLDVILGAGSFVLAWFLFPVIIILIASFFAENIIARVEQDEYGITQTRKRTTWQEIKSGLGFAGRALALNLICIPLYFIPIINIFAYYGVNAALIGREFFDMVAARHLADPDIRKIYRAYRLRIIFAGLIVVFAGTIPVLNLFSPIIGVILMTHLYHFILEDRPV